MLPKKTIAAVGFILKEEVYSLVKRAVFHPIKSSDDPKPYLGGLRSFVQNFREDNIDNKILNNIEQLYILQAQESQLNRLLLKLRRLRFMSIISSIMAVLCIYAAFMLVQSL
tara:strand:- start:1023 stop:1358 length:336 start_codon:yes stop_codon:yes gene_type:complete